jgi:3-methyladenine DNA glycosylase AlkC/predicted house-cleaning noncanonical NTP pyrophosphatase (MazG superfamily)
VGAIFHCVSILILPVYKIDSPDNLIYFLYKDQLKIMAIKSSSTSTNFINQATGKISITMAFGENLAALLADKILVIDKNFQKDAFCQRVKHEVEGQSYTKRVEIIADNLRKYLPSKYTEALAILMEILGPENQYETGMFTIFYWLMPVGKFVEKYGLNDFEASIKAIEEVTKRNTGEYAIRPYARQYPDQIIKICLNWSKSKNFHLRRLASEGLRPKLPWASKLETWINNPQPVFEILENLKSDEIKFVKKSVANHLRDWTKVNPEAAKKVIEKWEKSNDKNTQWIVKSALR